MSVAWTACFRILKQNSEKQRNGKLWKMKQHFHVNVSNCAHTVNHLISIAIVTFSITWFDLFSSFQGFFFITYATLFFYSHSSSIFDLSYDYSSLNPVVMYRVHTICMRCTNDSNEIFFLSFPLHAPVYGFLFWLCEFLLRIKVHNVLFFLLLLLLSNSDTSLWLTFGFTVEYIDVTRLSRFRKCSVK